MQTRDEILRRLVRHIRRCCGAFADGYFIRSQKTSLFCPSWISPDAKYWDHPIITPSVLKDYKALRIDIDADILHLSGVEQLHAFLNNIEKPLIQLLNGQPGIRGETIIKDDFDKISHPQSPITLLSAIFRPLQEARLPGISLYLHGSMADQTYTSFSDVDDLVVMRKEAWQDLDDLTRIGTELTKIANSYQNVDPFQHHGHWLITEFDLLSYDSSYLPLVVLEGAKRVTGNSWFDFCVQDNPHGFTENAIATIKSINSRLGQSANGKGLNAYDLKGLVGEIAIVPAYLFQTKGELISKKQAIKASRKIYSPLGYSAVEWATMVRKKFDMCVRNRRMNLLKKFAGYAVTRRHQAEKLIKKFSIWIGNEHPLGLNLNVRKSIEAFVRETELLTKQQD